ncbi:MAG: glycosyltransferase [Galactobacter sp.]
MHFVGITRFNLVTSATLGHFNSTAKLSLEQAKQRVYQPERLGTKLATFEHFCLPTYRALAAGNDRSHGLVLISHDLPEDVRRRLVQMCESVPRVRVVEFQDEDTLTGRIDPILAEIAGDEHVFNYRYDDDDVLAADFLNTVETVCHNAPTGTVVSLNRGFVVARLDRDSYGLFEQQAPLNAYGLGLVVDGARPRNIFDLGPHDKVSESAVHETQTPSWIAFRHGLNDSQSNATELKRLKLLVQNAGPEAETLAALGEHFPQLDLASLQSLPVVNVQENLEGIARRAIRRTRALEPALSQARKKLRANETALARTRKELRDVKASRSYRLARAIATTRSLRAVVSFPRRAWAACRR